MKGFSLIELLLVIVLIGILAAIAVPVYKTYSLKQKIATGYVVLNDFRDGLIARYDSKGSFPSSYSYASVNMASNSYNQVNLGAVKNLRFMQCPVSNAVYTEATLTGLSGVDPSYIDPTANNPGQYASIRMVSIANTNGVISSYCGMWVAGDNFSVPTSFLPTNCRCTNLITICNTGVVSNPC